MDGFSRSLAFLVAIDGYTNGIPVLRTPVSDAEGLADVLRQDHDFEVEILPDENATLEGVRALLGRLKTQIGSNDRVIFYFAGHGIALDNPTGPEGFLLPQNAERDNSERYLAMTELDNALTRLPCRHMLVILDCCFAGAFRWSSFRDLVAPPRKLHRERYEWFVRDAAWQAIASAAHDQRALDVADGQPLGTRDGAREHSPFARALIRGLKGAADWGGASGAGDGVITATELYLYLENELLPRGDDSARQTPIFWPMKKHDKGQFVFRVPGRELSLPPAPILDAAANPWRGLEPYEARHGELFFGRDDTSTNLVQRLLAERLIVVTGPSGIGKSSLIRAGVLPKLATRSLTPIVVRPGPSPFSSLARAVAESTPPGSEAPDEARLKSDESSLANWVRAWPGQGEVLLVIDQAEELVTMSRDDKIMESYLEIFATALAEHPGRLRVVFTVRSEFMTRLAQSALKDRWWDSSFVVPAMTQDELRRVIEGPAAIKVMRFEPAELVERLVNEVVQMPGALPLLSFALSQMYVNYLGRRATDRSLTNDDYDSLEGGILGSLQVRANELIGVWDEPHEATTRRLLERILADANSLAESGRAWPVVPDVEEPVENARIARITFRMSDAGMLIESRQGDKATRTIAQNVDLTNRNEFISRVKAAFDSYQATAKRVLERFVSVHSGELGRRRVPRQEFDSAGAGEQVRVEALLASLIEARLVVTDRSNDNAVLEFAHDALIHRWDRLRNWVLQDAPLIEHLRRLTSDANAWVKAPRQRSGMLWSDRMRLDIIRKLRSAASPGLNRSEHQFAEASRKRSVRNRLSRVGLVSVGACLVVSLVIVGRTETSRRLSGEAMADVRLRKISDAIDHARGALRSLPLGLGVSDRAITSGLSVLLNIRQRSPVDVDSEHVVDAAFSTDGTLLATASPEKGIRIRDTTTGGITASKGSDKGFRAVAFAPGTKSIVAGGDGTLALWNLSTGAYTPVEFDGGNVLHVAFSRNGQSMLALIERDGLNLVLFNGANLVARNSLAIEEHAVASFDKTGDSIVVYGKTTTKVVSKNDLKDVRCSDQSNATNPQAIAVDTESGLIGALDGDPHNPRVAVIDPSTCKTLRSMSIQKETADNGVSGAFASFVSAMFDPAKPLLYAVVPDAYELRKRQARRESESKPNPYIATATNWISNEKVFECKFETNAQRTGRLAYGTWTTMFRYPDVTPGGDFIDLNYAECRPSIIRTSQGTRGVANVVSNPQRSVMATLSVSGEFVISDATKGTTGRFEGFTADKFDNTSIALSSDGSQLAASDGRKLWLYDRSRQTQKMFGTVPDNISTIDFFPAQQKLLAVTVRGAMYEIDVATGALTKIEHVSRRVATLNPQHLIVSGKYTSNGEIDYVASDGTFNRWDRQSRRATELYPSDKGSDNTGDEIERRLFLLAEGERGEKVAFATENSIIAFDTRKRVKVCSIDVPARDLKSLMFTAMDSLILAGIDPESRDFGGVVVIDARDCAILGSLSPMTGSHFASGTNGRSIQAVVNHALYSIPTPISFAGEPRPEELRRSLAAFDIGHPTDPGRPVSKSAQNSGAAFASGSK